MMDACTKVAWGIFNHLRAPRAFPDASSPELASASAAERALAESPAYDSATDFDS